MAIIRYSPRFLLAMLVAVATAEVAVLIDNHWHPLLPGTLSVTTRCGDGVCEHTDVENEYTCDVDCPADGGGGPVCGNNVREGDEVCDQDPNIIGGQCTAGQYCMADCSGCTLGSGGGAFCGNGIINEGEQCDGGNLGGKTCTSPDVFDPPFLGGTLVCYEDCSFDASGCTGDPPASQASVPASQKSEGAASVPASQKSEGAASVPASQESANAASVPASQESEGAASVPASQESANAASVPASQESEGAASVPASQESEGAASVPASQESEGAASVPASTASATMDTPVIAPCGNGRVEQGEECDDGNNTSRDGCTAQCNVEAGWTCTEGVKLSGLPGSPLTAQVGGTSVWSGEMGASALGISPRPVQCTVSSQSALQVSARCSGRAMDIVIFLTLRETPPAPTLLVTVKGSIDRKNISMSSSAASAGTAESFALAGTFAGVSARAEGALADNRKLSLKFFVQDKEVGFLSLLCSGGCLPGGGGGRSGKDECPVAQGQSFDFATKFCVGNTTEQKIQRCKLLAAACSAAGIVTSPARCDIACKSGDDRREGIGAGGGRSICSPICGDILIVGSEECDDGNRNDGDGCSSTCNNEQSLGQCGDGTLDPGEQCDDGNTADGDGCSKECRVERRAFCCDVSTKSVRPFSAASPSFLQSLFQKLQGGSVCEAIVLAQYEEQANLLCQRLENPPPTHPSAPPLPTFPDFATTTSPVSPTCDIDADCPAEQSCKDGQCQSEAAVECGTDADCDGGAMCFDGACAVQCGPGMPPCPDSFACIGGLCQLEGGTGGMGGGGGVNGGGGGSGDECCVAADGSVSDLLPLPSTLPAKAWAATKEAVEWVIDIFKDIELNPRCSGGAVPTQGQQCGGGNEWGEVGWEEGECADGMDNDGDGDADCSDLACHISSGCGECYNDLLEQYYGTDDLEQREALIAQYPCDPKNSEFNECKDSSLMTDAPSESENDELSASLLAQGISLLQCSISTKRGFACCSKRTDGPPSEREFYPRWKCTGFNWPALHPYLTEEGFAAATCPTGTMQMFGIPPNIPFIDVTLRIPLRDALTQCASSPCATPLWCCDQSVGGWLATPAHEGASEPCKSSSMRDMYGSPRVIPPIADVIDGDLDSLRLPSDPDSPPSLLGYEEKPDGYWFNSFGSTTPPAALCKKIEFCCDHPVGKWRKTAPGQTCSQLSSANPSLANPLFALTGFIGGDSSLPVISASPYLQGNACKKAVFCRDDQQRKCNVVFEDAVPPLCITRPYYSYSVDGLQRCIADFPPVCNNGAAERGEECGEPGLTCTSPQVCRDCRCLDPNCGNAVLEPGEACEVSPDGFFPPCCVECQLAPQGVVCAPLPDGVDESCGLPGTCSGSNATCPAPELSPDGTLCGDEEVPPTCINGKCSALPYYWVLERTSVAGSVNEFCKRGDVCMNMKWEGGNQVCTWKKPPPFFDSSGLASTMPGERLSGMPPSGFASDPLNPARPTCPPVVWSHTWSWNQSRKRYEPRRSNQRWVPEKCKPVSGFIYFLQSPQPTFQIRSAGSPAFATLSNDLVQWWLGPGCPLHPYLAKLVAASEACHQFAQFKYWLDYNLTPANKVNSTQNSQAGQTPPRIYAALEAFQSHFNAIQTACNQLGTTAEGSNATNVALIVPKIKAVKDKLSDFRTAFRGNNGLLNKLSSAVIYSPNNSASHPQYLSVKVVKNAWLNALNFMKDPNTKLDQWITNTNI